MFCKCVSKWEATYLGSYVRMCRRSKSTIVICGSCTYGSQLSLLLWAVAAITAIALWTTKRRNSNTRASEHNRNKTPARTHGDTPGNVPLCISICAVKGESCSEHCIELRVSVSNVNDNRGCVTWISLETPLSQLLGALRDKVWSGGLGGAITANHGLCRQLITLRKRCNRATHLRACPAVGPLRHLNFASALAGRFSPIYVRCSRKIKAW